MHTDWDPSLITIDNDTVSDSWKVCIIDGVFQSENEYNGSLGARISSIFVIFFVSTFLTLFPFSPSVCRAYVSHSMSISLLATLVLVLLLQQHSFIFWILPTIPLAEELVWAVLETGGLYLWVPAIILVSIFAVFLLDVFMQVIVERKFGVHHDHSAGNKEVETAIIRNQANTINNIDVENTSDSSIRKERELATTEHVMSEAEIEHAWRQEFGAFLLLEFGVIFHSVLIGLNLGAVGDEFKTLYIVLCSTSRLRVWELAPGCLPSPGLHPSPPGSPGLVACPTDLWPPWALPLALVSAPPTCQSLTMPTLFRVSLMPSLRVFLFTTVLLSFLPVTLSLTITAPRILVSSCSISLVWF